MTVTGQIVCAHTYAYTELTENLTDLTDCLTTAWLKYCLIASLRWILLAVWLIASLWQRKWKCQQWAVSNITIQRLRHGNSYKKVSVIFSLTKTHLISNNNKYNACVKQKILKWFHILSKGAMPTTHIPTKATVHDRIKRLRKIIAFLP